MCTHRRASLGLLTCFLLVELGGLAEGQSAVWVVDAAGGPGSDFTEIQPAVDAASDGDVVLLRSGAYAGFVVDGKSVLLTADNGAHVLLTAAGVVRNLRAHQELLLRGVDTADDPGLLAADLLQLVNNEGEVWIEDCRLGAEVGTPFFFSGQAGTALVQDCRGVTFQRCTLLGRSMLDGAGAFPGHPALQCVNSNVSLYDCGLTGGNGGDGRGDKITAMPGAPGGDGALVREGTLFASGCHVEGGTGGGGTVLPCLFFPFGTEGGAGGNGLTMIGTARVDLLESTFAAGAGGLGTCGKPDGSDGVPVLPVPGQLVRHPGVARHLAIDSPVPWAQATAVSCGGVPGDLAFLLISVEQDHTFLPRLAGVLLPSAAAPNIRFLGQIPASGQLSTTLVVPALPPPAEGMVLFGQGVFVDPFLAVFLGGGSAVVGLVPSG